MTIDAIPKQYRETFHGDATDINLELTIQGHDAEKAFNKLKQHPETIKRLGYAHDIEDAFGRTIENPTGYLNIEMYSSNITKTLAILTSFNTNVSPNNITLIKGRYNDALESEDVNRHANTLINNLIIEQYQNNYKSQLFKTNDKEHPIISDIKDYLANKDTTYGLYVERVYDILSYTRYGKDKKERLGLHPIDRHFMVASYAKTQEKAHITGNATHQNLTVILESNYPHKVLDYLKTFSKQVIDAKFKRPLNSIKTAEIIVNLHTENLEETLIMLTNCPNSVIMDVYYNNLYDDKRHMIIAQTLLNQFKEHHPKDTFVVRQKETGTQKTYDTFPDDINPQTIGHIEQTASALYYRTIDQKTTLIFAKEKETAHERNC
jgi:hypothetical protein